MKTIPFQLLLLTAALTLTLPGQGCAASISSAPSPESKTTEADLVLHNGAIYTVHPERPWARALAVKDGVITYVGSPRGSRAHIGRRTEVIDLGGLMILPGLHDVHMHPLEAFHPAFSCALPDRPALEGVKAVLRRCARERPGGGWLLGYGVSIGNIVRHLASGGRSPLAILDQAIPDRPVAILESTSHSVWANSRALARAGFGAGTPDPAGGVILREKTGEILGILIDSAGERVLDTAFESTPEFRRANDPALRDGLALANRHGITSIADARVYWRRGHVAAYRRAERRGALSARVVLGLWAYPGAGDRRQLERLASMFSRPADSLLRISQIKIYVDGEISHTTAALFDPYLGPRLAGPTGLNYFDPPRLTRYITELERAGFDFHIHAIGDRGVSEALDAIEAAASVNGDLGQRHRLTHIELVAPADVPRFAELGVTADFQLSVGGADPAHHLGPQIGRDRADKRAWRLRDLWESGARVVLSSDYDVGEVSPFLGMEHALLRGDQSLGDLHAAIRAYTLDPAYVLRQEDRVGSLEVGKEADLIVIDRHLFQIPRHQISDTKVLWTLLRGEEVYWDPNF